MQDIGNKNVMAANIRRYMAEKGINAKELSKAIKVPYTTVLSWTKAEYYPRIDKIEMMSDYFGCLKSDLIESKTKFPAPNITDDYVTFPVLGGIAAGYNHIADESWSGETIDIPSKYLRGISRENFFVLRVKGNSMYPLYHDGDMVLIRKQSTLNRSGEIGAILYDDECATLKKVEYVTGENWLVLLPINPDYPPERIEGERLEHCRVIGVPFLLVREILE